MTPPTPGPDTHAADPRRMVPRTDAVLAHPDIAAAALRLGRDRVKRAVTGAQQRARRGEIAPEQVADDALAALPSSATRIRPVLNASGVLLHTNLGRAPLSATARQAVDRVAGTCDVELDLATGERGRRGAAVLDALLDAVPAAQAAHVVNNGAAAVALVASALAFGREIVVSAGELVEIGDGFRLPELIESTGARLRPVGTTNRTHLRDYTSAIGQDTALVLKVHPSNFVVHGFTSGVEVAELAAGLAGTGVPVVVDIGSGLLAPHPVLPDEPDVASTLAAGADLVTASGDKLLGGPQAGLLLGGREIVTRVRRHPLARAVRVDKLTLAALEATVAGPPTPVRTALEATVGELSARCERIAAELAGHGVDARAVDSVSTVGGGGAPGVELPSAAVSLPESFAAPLRTGDPAVLGRVAHGRCLLDLRALAPGSDDELVAAVRSVAGS